LSHLFNNIVVALFDTYVTQFTWAIPNPIHAFVKHKDSSLISFQVHSSKINLTCHPNSQINILQSTSLLPYPSCLRILRNLKCWTKLFSIACRVWFMIVLYDVFMLCYFCFIVCTESYMLSWEKWKDHDLQKGKWHIYLTTYFLLLH
jgi:hypothetical protein